MVLREGTIRLNHAHPSTPLFLKSILKWLILYYFPQHKEACMAAVFFSGCFGLSICMVVLQTLAQLGPGQRQYCDLKPSM